jgi:hypothetical protein
MMDHAVISVEEVDWSCTSSDDDQTGCAPEVRHEIESGIKCVWLNSTLMDMVAQDEAHKSDLHSSGGHSNGDTRSRPPGTPPPIEFIGEQSHSKDNCAYIKQLEEELHRARATI